MDQRERDGARDRERWIEIGRDRQGEIEREREWDEAFIVLEPHCYVFSISDRKYENLLYCIEVSPNSFYILIAKYIIYCWYFSVFLISLQ